MKTPAFLLAGMLVATLLLGAAAASHGPHSPCGVSTLSVGNTVRVDVWANNRCAGATVYATTLTCIVAGQHLHAAGAHVMTFYGSVCETGVLLELP